MYTQVWTKYLPVIRIVLKRAITAEQILNLNIPDFERSGISKKSGHKFLLKFRDGKVSNVIIDYPLASALSNVLLQDAVVKQLFMDNEFHISLNPKFQLTVKHIPHPVVVTEEVAMEAVAE